jgi:hypothetical protein
MGEERLETSEIAAGAIGGGSIGTCVLSYSSTRSARSASSSSSSDDVGEEVARQPAGGKSLEPSRDAGLNNGRRGLVDQLAQPPADPCSPARGTIDLEKRSQRLFADRWRLLPNPPPPFAATTAASDRVFPITERRINYIVKATAQRAGINPAASAHWLRHANASQAIGLAEFERELIRERVNAGLAAAREEGRTGGRPKLEDARVHELRGRLAQRQSWRTIAREMGISQATISRYTKRGPGESQASGAK